MALTGQNVQNFFIENARNVTIMQSPDLDARVADLEQRLKDWEATATEAGVPQDELSKADQELERSPSGAVTPE